jgi:hypothetical protein
VDKIVRLSDENDTSIGLLGGLKDNIIYSPFSAPFGGFHYLHGHLSYDKIFSFVANLKEFVAENGFERIVITLPPDIYQSNMNAKLVHAFIKQGFNMAVPDIVNILNLKKFNGKWVKSSVAQNCRKAIRNKLSFAVVTDEKSMKDAFEIICRNRTSQSRQVRMNFQDVLNVNDIIPLDFFLVKDKAGNSVGSSIFYRGHQTIVQGVFLGDDIEKRSLPIMDFLFMNIYDFYKKLDYEYINLGTSSSDGEPNIGLIRFKEIHNCDTVLQYTFSWGPDGL